MRLKIRLKIIYAVITNRFTQGYAPNGILTVWMWDFSKKEVR